MDLILERVQNKFACIIGELCSEPIVLSKFAIWLDLRLAEYKAKGAISLDCLGENPDPIWLKGHEKPLSDCTNITRPYSTNLKQPLSHGGFSSREPFGQSEENTHPLAFETHDRLSPEILEVKKENFGNVEEVYPVSLHSVGVSEKGKNRKRTASQASENFIDSTPSKKWQSSSLQNVTLEETNQSLMSIIGESQDNDESSVTDSTFQTSFSIPDEQASTSSILAEPRGDDSGSWSNLQASRSQGEASVSQPPGQDTADISNTVDVTRRRKLLTRHHPFLPVRNTSPHAESNPVESKPELGCSTEQVFPSTSHPTLELDCQEASCEYNGKESETIEERFITMNEKLNGTISVVMQLQDKLNRLSSKPPPVTKRETASQTEEPGEVVPAIETAQSPHEGLLTPVRQSDDSKDAFDDIKNKTPEENVPEFTDKRLLNLHPIDLEGHHIDRDSLQELVDRLGTEQPSEVALQDIDVLNILSKSQGCGHFAKNLVYRYFNIGELYGRNACGRNFMLPGRCKKKALDHQKLREILDLVCVHFKGEDNCERTAVRAINAGLRYLWNVRLKFAWLNIRSML